MSSILLVTSSPRGAASHSTRVATDLALKLRDADLRQRIVIRDLVTQPLPHIDPDYASGIYTPAEARSQRQADAVAVSDAVLDELVAADKVILATGMINFSITSTLKSWIDHVARSGKSFAYGENGPKGLLTGKKVYIVLASGGIYSQGGATQMDHAIPYLRSVLAFMGMTDVEVIRVEGVAMGADAAASALDKAAARIDAIATEAGNGIALAA